MKKVVYFSKDLSTEEYRVWSKKPTIDPDGEDSIWDGPGIIADDLCDDVVDSLVPEFISCIGGECREITITTDAKKPYECNIKCTGIWQMRLNDVIEKKIR
jgi:hypothetical protein